MISYITMLIVSIIVFLCAKDTVGRSKSHFVTRSSSIINDASFWMNRGMSDLRSRVKTLESPIVGQAKNIVFFLGDGMSLATVTAARVHMEQTSGRTLPESNGSLTFENFPYTGLVRTYCVDKQVADSACSSTAYMTGVKANSGTLGVTGAVKENDCEASLDAKNRVDSILRWAQMAGKSTGIVTTTRVTHASPAGGYAHSANRGWESSAPNDCLDIAQQLMTQSPGIDLDVILGGGRQEFLPKNMNGNREDGRNLIAEWKVNMMKGHQRYDYVRNKTELLNANLRNLDKLLGLFSMSHMSYTDTMEVERDEPSLSEMTVAAIEVLRKNKNGYVLFIEGGRIDHAHHQNLAHMALSETIAFSNAVNVADTMTNPKNTLIVVTSDHSHTMTINGYPSRTDKIIGHVERGEEIYSILSYANGPSANSHTYEKQSSKYGDKFALYPSLVPMSQESHGGEDVAVWARGPWAHLFVGSFEQNVLPLIMSYASCIGPNEGKCSNR
ncbi:Alkaline-phosphatase-like, core domain,Alkaline phosphatase-like, alpha/beta/alpha,Alkaline phosphatase [Cinara cedri]|uniref:alkaline phosphatase n=1 Tax=Cinara cedri TaxID=506608 RepID=A0A5E4MSL2_9HEMI|nr:Alkaline-phosphatase-like, core domain,Alkaline phosphatase-like, alpha/beta/alpha,Alkaline phosphatase [Cinara cedri]